jgi:hypothetical protein
MNTKNELSPPVIEKRQSVFNKVGIKEKYKSVNICETISHAENQVQHLKDEMDMIYYSYMTDKDKMISKKTFVIEEQRGGKDKKPVNKVKLKDLQKLFNGTAGINGKKNKFNLNNTLVKNSKNGNYLELNSIPYKLRPSIRLNTIENTDDNTLTNNVGVNVNSNRTTDAIEENYNNYSNRHQSSNLLQCYITNEDKNLKNSRKNSKFHYDIQGSDNAEIGNFNSPNNPNRHNSMKNFVKLTPKLSVLKTPFDIGRKSNFAQYLNTTNSLNKNTNYTIDTQGAAQTNIATNFNQTYQSTQSDQTDQNDLVTITYVDTVNFEDDKNSHNEKNSHIYIHSNMPPPLPKKNSLFKIKKPMNITGEKFKNNIIETRLSKFKKDSRKNIHSHTNHDMEISHQNLSYKKNFKLESNRTHSSINSTSNDFFSTNNTGRSNLPDISLTKSNISKSLLNLNSDINKNSTSSLILQTTQPVSKTHRNPEKSVIKNINHLLSEAYKCGDDLKFSVIQSKTSNKEISLQKEKIKEKLDEQMVNDKKSLGGFGKLKEKLRKGFFTLESIDRFLPAEKMVYKTFDKDGILKRIEKINIIREEDEEKNKEFLEKEYGVNQISPEEIAHREKLSKNHQKRSRVKDMLLQLSRHRKKLEKMTSGLSPRENYMD